ncbi:hypothetical protein [uncultured Ferrimonas sp.]|uniref:hypothetical protein n=1 Tax=uncultured Ferrimonas sp. TaxID=432640 RepID=UPI002639C5E9|nr:hypothetical protein [uncultured Ferrimonas sp.]
MNLGGSLLITAAIAVAVVVALQFSSAQAATVAAQKPALASASSATILLQRRIALTETPAMWVQFYQQQQQPLTAKQQLLVRYNNFNPDFSDADITIAVAAEHRRALVPQRLGTTLLATGNHSAETLTQAWQQIDYGRGVAAVVEIHDLNQHGLPNQSELTVYYGNVAQERR